MLPNNDICSMGKCLKIYKSVKSKLSVAAMNRGVFQEMNMELKFNFS